jgi:Family of unknown function (DUF6325)
MSDQTAQSLGPVQMLVVGFDGNRFEGRILAELERLSEQNIVRLVDLLFVSKDESGAVTALEASDLGVDPGGEPGKHLATLIGLAAEGEGSGEPEPGDDEYDLEQVWFVADEIPAGTAAAIVLLEHRWALGLREATQAADGELLAEAWVHPLDLAAVGLGDAASA